MTTFFGNYDDNKTKSDQFYNDLFSPSTREGYLNKERSRQLILNDIISRPSTLEEIESSVEPTSSEKKKATNIEPKVRNERENTDTVEAKKPPSSSVKPVAKSLSDVDRLRNIAMNSREVRLIGPDGKEVEMKDDVPTKIVVAFENLQKEASQVWDQVNTKLDKGWNDFKTMVERAVSKQQQP